MWHLIPLWIWEQSGCKAASSFFGHNFPLYAWNKINGLQSQSHLQFGCSAVRDRDRHETCQCGVVFWSSAMSPVFLFRGCEEKTSAARTLRPRSTGKLIEWQFWLSVNYSQYSFKQTWAPLLFLKHGDLQLFCLLLFTLTLKSIYQTLNRLGIKSENNTFTLKDGLVVYLYKTTANACMILMQSVSVFWDELKLSERADLSIHDLRAWLSSFAVTLCSGPAGRLCHRCWTGLQLAHGLLYKVKQQKTAYCGSLSFSFF